MVRYFILIKRKGSKQWRGAIPARKGVSVSRLRKVIQKQLKTGYTARIVSETALKKLLVRQAPKGIKKRKRKK